MDQIVIGMVSGLFTTFLIWVVAVVWKHRIKPFWEELVYKDIKIEGKWEAKYTNQIEHSSTVSLKRKGHRVKGKIFETDGPDKGKEYIIEGDIRNSILTLMYNSSNRSELDRGTITLIVKENGKSLSGHTAYYKDQIHDISTLPYEWKRIKA